MRDSISMGCCPIGYPPLTVQSARDERLAVAGCGAIGCGLAATASRTRPVVLWARSPRSADRARARVEAVCERAGEGADPSRVAVATDLDALADATVVVEAVVEDLETKRAVLGALTGVAAADALLATTTSSLPLGALAAATGAPERFAALHVFNPVPKMELVELAFPPEATEATRERARGLCEALGKVAIEVPDVPGFVVNRLLFPYLFGAVELREATGLEPDAIDACMTLGAGHPMGPLALLDLVGLDVAIAIGEALGLAVPDRVRALVAEGALGRKSGRGFYDHAPSGNPSATFSGA
jgi:3-hydroxybutyryl-CoA dehydrogenase